MMSYVILTLWMGGVEMEYDEQEVAKLHIVPGYDQKVLVILYNKPLSIVYWLYIT